MKIQLKKNTSAEQAYIRDLERNGPLERVERGQSKILSPTDYPEPIKRFLARHRSVLQVRLSAPAKKKLERLSRATGIDIDKLARRWVEQGIAREAS